MDCLEVRIAEAIKHLPPHITIVDWTWLVNNKFFTEAFLKRRKLSIDNRAKAVMHHRSGSKPHRTIMYDMGGKDGNPPDFLSLFFETRQKDGKLQDEEATKKYDEIVETIQSKPSLSTIEVIDKCFGPQTHSHVFGYGGGIKRKDILGSKSTKEKELEDKMQEKDWKKNINSRLDQLDNGGAQLSSVALPTSNTNHHEAN
ncbi:uncharacterized protein [Euphorbia lathyris]|uniref:uncharacterized protein isoform X1 n=1 Tax=Euphorbia lathyris TaxID=212925 RepID=UPI0033138497